MRRARNIISRTRSLAALAADLLDAGRTDAEVAEAISARAGCRVRAATVAAFRVRDYSQVEQQRMERREAAARVEMIVAGAAGTYARAGQELLARMLYDVLTGAKEMSPSDLIAAGKTFAKIRDIEIAEIRAESARNREEERRKAEEAASAAGDAKLTPEERATRIKEIFGFK